MKRKKFITFSIFSTFLMPSLLLFVSCSNEQKTSNYNKSNNNPSDTNSPNHDNKNKQYDYSSFVINDTVHNKYYLEITPVKTENINDLWADVKCYFNIKEREK